MQDEKTIVIDINLTRGLVALLALALLMAAFLGYLAWGQREAAASGSQASFGYAQDRPLDHARDKPLAASAGLRGYYLTQNPYTGSYAGGTDGNGAGVCASGYHFASLWEILDPSNLKYNTTLGYTSDDSGQGPPTSHLVPAWVRTGYVSSTSSTTGTANCNAWTSSSHGDYGTYAYLSDDWTAGQDIHVWEVGSAPCSDYAFVWCVED